MSLSSKVSFPKTLKSRAPAVAPSRGVVSTHIPQDRSTLSRLLPSQPATIPISAFLTEKSVAKLQEKVAADAALDPREAQADSIAERALYGAVPQGPVHGGEGAERGRQKGASVPASGSSPLVAEASRSEGEPLDAATRGFFEKQLGQDFSDVRIHADARAQNSAQSIGARAYTAGSHVVFGMGGYDPRAPEGQRVLAHELAHVVQQRTDGYSEGRIQRKLIASGDTAGFVAFANSAIGVQFEVVVAASGEVSVQSTNVAGPPTRESTELVNALKTSINDAHLINMEFIHGATSVRPEDASVLGGNYALGRVDLDDISALGTQEAGVSEGRTGGSILVHEVTEQYRKQVHGEGFAVAHATATRAEEAAIGATRGAESYRRVNPTTLEVTIPYTYPDGHIVEVTWDIVNGNYGNVRRKVIPAPAHP